jgi:anti-sigma factor RsiW
MTMADENDLACHELIKIVTAYQEGTLPIARRERFDAHLQTCEGCRRYLYQMDTAVRIAGTLHGECLAPAARDELLRLFRDWDQS